MALVAYLWLGVGGSVLAHHPASAAVMVVVTLAVLGVLLVIAGKRADAEERARAPGPAEASGATNGLRPEA